MIPNRKYIMGKKIRNSNFTFVFPAEQKKIDRIDPKDKKSILQFIQDTERKTIFNSINKAPLISKSKHGKSRLKIIHELYIFIVKNYIKKILLASFNKKIKDNIFMFSFGRLFSKFNDVGVQVCTDFDFNIIINDVIVSEKKKILKSLNNMKKLFWQEYKIEVEINNSFTVITFSELKKRIGRQNRDCLKYSMFYKSIEGNYYIFNDNQKIREYILKKTSVLSDLLIFEQYLGLYSGNKNSFFRIKRGDPLVIIPDIDSGKKRVSNVIGSKKFRKMLKVSNLMLVNKIPEEWYFSMKYMVNRVYDYICAMRAKDYSFTDIGFEKSDYKYIREVNLMMLFLQGIKYVRLNKERFGVSHDKYDFSYISSYRIKFFSAIHPKIFGDAIKSIIYDMKIIPRNDDRMLLEKYLNK